MLQGGASCETSVRPVTVGLEDRVEAGSMFVGGRLTSFQVAVAGKRAVVEGDLVGLGEGLEHAPCRCSS